MSNVQWPVPAPKSRLRDVLDVEGIVLCPGVTNPMEARIAADVGFHAVYATGAGIANVLYGVPDIGLLAMPEILEVSRRIASQSSVPVVSDIDTGFGGPLQVQRTVREFEAAGVDAVQLEDQVNPKRCGHFDGTKVVPTGEMVERIVSAVEARQSDELLLIARTDALASEGLGSALKRAAAYCEAGVDAMFVEAPRTLDELQAIPDEVSVPAVVNMVEGGRTPIVEASVLEEMGYRIAIYANMVARLSAWTTRRGLQTLLDRGSSDALVNEILSWEERQDLVGLPDYQAEEDRLVSQSALVTGRIFS